MATYGDIHLANAALYERITSAPNYLTAISESTGCSRARTLENRKLYVKFILGSRINPNTHAKTLSRFHEAWTKARKSRGLSTDIGVVIKK